MEKFAPIVIPTLNRIDHFKRCIESLSKCHGSDKTELIIALDYPLKDTHRKGYEEIRLFLPTISEFKKVTVIERENNFGAVKNFFETLNFVFSNSDTLIFTEDDNVFSNDFLFFVNNGLNTYQDRNDIFSVSGYQYPVKFPENYKNDIYLWKGFSAWGVGLWKDKWNSINFEEDNVEKTIKTFLHNPIQIYKLHKIANHYLPTLIRLVEEKKHATDAYICLYQYLNGIASVFPKISRVRNYGHDGSGVNGGYLKTNIYRNQKLYDGDCDYTLPPNIITEKMANKILHSHFNYNYKTKLTILLKYINYLRTN